MATGSTYGRRVRGPIQATPDHHLIGSRNAAGILSDTDGINIQMVAGACLVAMHNAFGGKLVRRWELPRRGARFDLRPRESA